MKQTIYVDILFIVNLYINAIILISVSKVAKKNIKKIRLVCASAVGACYSFVIFVNLPQSLLILSNIIVSFIIITIFLGVHSLIELLRNTLLFYLINFIFAGSMYCIFNFFTPKNMIVRNMIVYFDISPIVLMGTTLIVYAFLTILNRITQNKSQGTDYTVNITLQEKSIQLKGYFDTGNVLRDHFSDMPVVICEYTKIKNIFSEELDLNVQRSFNIDGFHSITYEKNSVKLKFIPYEAVGVNSIIPAIKPDKFTITDRNNKTREIERVLIGIINSKILNGEYDILLNSQI